MSWLPDDFQHPELVELPTGQHLRPIRASDAEIDLPAVMGSRDRLFSIYGEAWGGWPPAAMTLEQDRDDLAHHEPEIHAHESFHYALLDAPQADLLGGVYHDPPPAPHAPRGDDPRAGPRRPRPPRARDRRPRVVQLRAARRRGGRAPGLRVHRPATRPRRRRRGGRVVVGGRRPRRLTGGASPRRSGAALARRLLALRAVARRRLIRWPAPGAKGVSRVPAHARSRVERGPGRERRGGARRGGARP